MAKENFWREFKTKKALTEHIQNILARYDFEEPFQNDLISDLIAERHTICAAKGYRPDGFKKIPYRLNEGPRQKGYSFLGWFSNLNNGAGTWHGVSWRKCITPPSQKNSFFAAFRRVAEPYTREHFYDHSFCERCLKSGWYSAAEEIDHVQPEFKETAKHAWSMLTPNQWHQLYIDTYDWEQPGEYQLPSDHPAAKYIEHVHEKEQVLMAVCKDCHRLNQKGRDRDKKEPTPC